MYRSMVEYLFATIDALPISCELVTVEDESDSQTELEESCSQTEQGESCSQTEQGEVSSEKDQEELSKSRFNISITFCSKAYGQVNQQCVDYNIAVVKHNSHIE